MYDIDLKFTEDVHQQVYLTSDAAPLQKSGAWELRLVCFHSVQLIDSPWRG